MKMLGIALVILGLLGLAYGGFSYTQNKKVLEVGSLEVHADQKTTVPIPPIAGGVALVAGVLLVVADRRRV